MAENKEFIEDDEINLIDLFIVLLKHRRLILGTTLAVLVILGTGYFIYPAYQYQKAVDSQVFEANMSVGFRWVADIFWKEYDLKRDFLNAHLVLSALREAGYTELSYGESDISLDAQNMQALNIVRQRLVNNQSMDGNPLEENERLFKVTVINNKLHLTYIDENSDRALAFLASLVRNINKKLILEITPQLDYIVSSYQRLLSIEAPNDVTKEVIVVDSEKYEAASTILEGESDVLIVKDESYVFKAEIAIENFKGNYRKMAIIVIFAVFFLSIFLAFILNAVEQVKSNDDSMAKIREALKKK